MVLTGYSYHERPFKKGDLKNPFHKQKRSFKEKGGKSGEKAFDKKKLV